MNVNSVTYLVPILLFVGVLACTLILSHSLKMISRRKAEAKLLAENDEKNRLSECCLCWKSKYVKPDLVLVRGKNGSVCANCVVDSLCCLDEDTPGKSQYLLKTIVSKICDYPNPTVDRNLFKYLLDQSKVDSNFRQNVFEELLTKRCSKYLVSMLNEKPSDGWTKNDILTWTWANCQQGDYQKSLKYPKLNLSENEKSDVIFERHLEINRVAAQLNIDASKENIEECLISMLNVKKALESNEYPMPSDENGKMPYVLGNIAYCYYLAADYDACLEYISMRRERLHEGNGTDGYIELLTGKVYEKLNQSDKAIQHWEKGLEDDMASYINRKELIQKLNTVST